MQRTAIIILFMLASLMFEPFVPRQAQEHSVQVSQARAALNGKAMPTLTVADNQGSFVLRNLRLVRASGSAKLSGELVNQTNRSWKTLMFALKAYDRFGRLLEGSESETIFAFHRVGKNASAPINSGYGVWLQGINFDAVASLEVVRLDQTRTSHARHSVDLAEIEE